MHHRIYKSYGNSVMHIYYLFKFHSLNGIMFDDVADCSVSLLCLYNALVFHIMINAQQLNITIGIQHMLN